MLNEHECRAFLQLAKDRSFSKAAKHLYVSQPSLSQCIKRIEAEINTTLIDRSCTPLELTEAGEIFLKEVEKIKLIRENIVQSISDFSELKVGSVIVGSSHTRSAWLTHKVLPKFFLKYPGVKVEVMEHPTSKLHEYVRSGDIDIALIYEPVEDKLLETIPIRDEKVLLAVPLNHPLAIKYKDRDKISFKELQDVPMIILKPTRKMREIYDDLCYRTAVKPKVIFEANNILMATELTVSNVGPTLITDTVAYSSRYSGAIKVFELEEAVAERKLVAAYNCHKVLSKAARKFVDELIENK